LSKDTSFANFSYLKMIVFFGVIPCSVAEKHKHFGFKIIMVIFFL
jgi:hypothetical protein